MASNAQHENLQQFDDFATFYFYFLICFCMNRVRCWFICDHLSFSDSLLPFLSLIACCIVAFPGTLSEKPAVHDLCSFERDDS